MGRRWTAVIIAVILGFAAVFLTNIYFQQKEQSLEVEEAPVLVAAADISKGSVIEYDMLAFKTLPVDFIQPGALRSKEAAVGKTAEITIMAGEQVLGHKLATAGLGSLTLASKTPPGKRAFTIGMDAASAVGGMLRPGDHVDVLAVFSSPSITVLLFQDILVLAVGEEMTAERREERSRTGLLSAAASGRDSVTLALTPQEVQVITVAMDRGKVKLTLRPRAEAGPSVPAVDLSRLPPAIDLNILLQFYTRPVEPMPSVEIIRGLKKETTPLPGR